MLVEDGVYIDKLLRLHYPEGAKWIDDVPEDLMDVVNEHWKQYPPQHPLFVHIAGLFFFVMTFICIFGNLLIIILFLITADIRTPANFLMVNLAFSDMAMFGTQGPLMFINAFSAKCWMFGSLVCKLYGFMGGVFGTASIVTMTFIAWDRYNVIVHGLNSHPFTIKRAVITITLIWIYSVVVSMGPFFGWGGYELEGLFLTCSYEYLTDDSLKQSFILFAFVFSYVIPLAAIFRFYSRIVKEVFFREAAMKRAQVKLIGLEPSVIDEIRKWKVETRVTKVIIINIMLWVVAWTPYAIVTLVGAFGNRQSITPLVSQFPSFFAKFAAIFNPVFTLRDNPKFRNSLAEKFNCFNIAPYEFSIVHSTSLQDKKSLNSNVSRVPNPA